MANAIDLTALVGTVMFVWMPENGYARTHAPGPKYRPVLVVDADNQTGELKVAYGTSQRTNQCGRGEITFTPSELPKLTKPTKFCLGTAYWVPATMQYLACKKTQKPTVIGAIPRSRWDDLYERVLEVKSND